MTLSSVRGYMMSASGHCRSVSIAIASPNSPQENASRIPMVECRFKGWPLPQPYIHDCAIRHHGSRFRVYFQRHKWLPMNSTLNIRGDLLILRLGTKNRENVVNLRVGDTKMARRIAKRWVFFPPANLLLMRLQICSLCSIPSSYISKKTRHF
jgi:hypothetical protein